MSNDCPQCGQDMRLPADIVPLLKEALMVIEGSRVIDREQVAERILAVLEATAEEGDK